MAKMTDDALKTLVAARKNACVGYMTTEFTQDRIEALSLYRGDPLGDEEEGLSTVVSRDVMEAVESMLPSLMRPFISGDEVVRFEPVGDSDEDQATQATDYINYLFMKRNDSFSFIYDTLKDGLMMRLGVAKVVREEYTDSATETYAGLSELELEALGSDDAVTIASKEPSDAPQMPGMPPAPMWNVTATRSTDKARIKVYVVPVDEFLFERQLARLDDATFVGQRCRKTVADLIDMGLDENTCLDLPEGDSQDFARERLNRFEDENVSDNGNTDPRTRLVWVTESFIKCAYDGKSVGWRRTIIAGSADELLLNEEADGHPYSSWTPVPIPHKLVGMSITDMTRDIMLIKTALWRESLNNAYLTNRPQREVVIGQVNMDDLLTPRIGGVVRVKAPGMVREMVTPFTAGDSFQLIEYADSTREQRTGVTRYNQGMDANSLNKTATGISAIMSASQQRQELVARLYAEFLKRIFRKMLELVCKYPNDEDVQRATKKAAVPMDPREWSTEYDMTVSVGLGTGDRQVEVGHMQALLQLDQSIIQIQGGVQGPILTVENVYQKLKRLGQSMGIKGFDRMYADPNAPPDPNAQQAPQQPDPQAMAMQQQQAQQQAETQAHQAKLGNEASMAQMKAQSDASTKIQVATIQAQADVEIARIRADADREMGIHRAIGTHITAVATMPGPKPDNTPQEAAGASHGTSDGKGGTTVLQAAHSAVTAALAHQIEQATLPPDTKSDQGVDLSYVDPGMSQ